MTRVLAFIVVVWVGSSISCTMPSLTSSGKTYEELVAFFKEWRSFQAPEMINGVPNYSAEAMKKKAAELPGWKKKLESFDTTGWTIPHQVDWYLVWAEMNGLDFELRVQQSWVKDPAFYVWFFSNLPDTPGREGPHINGCVQVPDYTWPLSDGDANEMAERLRKAPMVFQQARMNLTGDARDLWMTGIRSINEQAQELEEFAASVQERHADLAAAAREAKEASDDFAKWLVNNSSSKKGPSGVGKDNFSWNLKYVHLVPYDWHDEKILLERELYRAHSGLRLAEYKNRNLPKLEKKNNAKEYDEMLQQGVTDFISFMDKEEFMTVKPYMDPALRAQIRPFVPTDKC